MHWKFPSQMPWVTWRSIQVALRNKLVSSPSQNERIVDSSPWRNYRVKDLPMTVDIFYNIWLGIQVGYKKVFQCLKTFHISANSLSTACLDVHLQGGYKKFFQCQDILKKPLQGCIAQLNTSNSVARDICTVSANKIEHNKIHFLS